MCDDRIPPKLAPNPGDLWRMDPNHWALAFPPLLPLKLIHSYSHSLSPSLLLSFWVDSRNHAYISWPSNWYPISEKLQRRHAVQPQGAHLNGSGTLGLLASLSKKVKQTKDFSRSSPRLPKLDTRCFPPLFFWICWVMWVASFSPIFFLYSCIKLHSIF